MNRFGTVLVANRGEIALRVIRACRSAGLRSVAVFSDADRNAQHVGAADHAVRLGPAAASESYLSIPALLDAAKQTGADAVHPGYGFLSERAEFARAVADVGMVFVGPTPSVMDAMGRKDRARAIAVSAGVPVVPAATLSSGEPDLDVIAEEIGFPLLAKAAAGGGGKGMRIVRSADEFAQAVEAGRREARAAFGDDAMIFERYIEHGRHIEVQIVGDEHGNVVHLFERDCSVQRRHQKVIEEAPAVAISADVRDLVLASAVDLARKVEYVSAGTVEFLVSGRSAYFLEMNTRLQVEHPVTELVTGLDLVALQLAIAQGERLPVRQRDIAINGHAIEARVYAEDARNGFLPQAGVAAFVRWPSAVRVDAALETGQEVTTHYDPMLGKVITWGATRQSARRGLVDALDDTAIVGLTTNAGFLRDLADSAAYRNLMIDTAWLDAQPDSAMGVPESVWVFAAWALASAGTETSAVDLGHESAWNDPLGRADGWRVAGPPAGVTVVLASENAAPAARPEQRLLVVRRGDSVVSIGGHEVCVTAIDTKQNVLRLEIDGLVESATVIVGTHRVWAAYRGETYQFVRPDAFESSSHHMVADGTVVAPMPGTVLTIGVTAGDLVEAGDVLGAMEAMKMEFALKAPFDGVVADVLAMPGESVDRGAHLVVVRPEVASTADPADPGSATPGAQDG